MLSRQVLRRIVASTLGNPLFILEVGRALREQGVPRTGDDIPVPQGVEELLGTRVSRLASELRRLLLAVALRAELRIDELAAVVSAQVVEEAADTGLLLIDGGRVRAAHPLLAATAKKRELHLTVAEAVVDDALRTHHLALAHRDPDARLAAAAASACARGARRSRRAGRTCAPAHAGHVRGMAGAAARAPVLPRERGGARPLAGAADGQLRVDPERARRALVLAAAVPEAAA